MLIELTDEFDFDNTLLLKLRELGLVIISIVFIWVILFSSKNRLDLVLIDKDFFKLLIVLFPKVSVVEGLIFIKLISSILMNLLVEIKTFWRPFEFIPFEFLKKVCNIVVKPSSTGLTLMA